MTPPFYVGTVAKKFHVRIENTGTVDYFSATPQIIFLLPQTPSGSNNHQWNSEVWLPGEDRPREHNSAYRSDYGQYPLPFLMRGFSAPAPTIALPAYNPNNPSVSVEGRMWSILKKNSLARCGEYLISNI